MTNRTLAWAMLEPVRASPPLPQRYMGHLFRVLPSNSIRPTSLSFLVLKGPSSRTHITVSPKRLATFSRSGLPFSIAIGSRTSISRPSKMAQQIQSFPSLDW